MTVSFTRQFKQAVAVVLVPLALAFAGVPSAPGAFRVDLQGQHATGTNWVGGPLLGWMELEYIPVRVLFTGGPATNQVITVSFDHTKSLTIRGIENLTGFTVSSNVIITSGPTLSAPSGVDIWNYQFTITITDAASGFVEFRARLAAGAHGFPGSSLNLSLVGPGQLQISKPAASLGSPDLILHKSGPAEAKTNQVITYAIVYTNKVIVADTARGVQITDILPPEVTYVPNSASKGGKILGNTLTWDLGNLIPGRRGLLTYKAVVTTNIAVTTTFANFAQIQSSQDDANPADNTSSVQTTVVVTPNPLANDDFYGMENDETLTIPAPGVLLNDSNALSAVLFSAPEEGSLTFNTNGSFTYVPDTGFTGTVLFAYQALNGTNLSGPAIVTIEVTNSCDFVVSTNITTRNDAGQCGAVVNYPPPMTTGTCAPVVCNPPAGTSFPVGATTVTCTNADGISRSFTVTVVDAEPPAITCQNLSFTADTGQCSRSNISYVVTSADNCSTNWSVICDPPTGSTFPSGMTVVNCTVADEAGNTNSCTFTVTVSDNELPVISCPMDVTVNVDSGLCYATSVSLGTPLVSDNCGTITVTSNAPAQFPVGTNLVTWTATDPSGNVTTCQQRVIVRDNQAPAITCPADVTVNADAGSCFATGVSLGNPNANDNCGTVTVSSNAPAQFPVGTNLVTWTATDSSGNASTCQQRVIVRDNQAPAITCPPDVTVNADAGSCFATGVSLGNPTTSDNCGAVTVTSNAPAQFPVGTNLVTWTVTDASGNASTCQQRVIVRDNQAPAITCPADVTVNADAGSCFATGVSLGNPNANDNCGTVTVSSNAPAQFPVGTNLVTWTATDASGNATTCQQRVVVRDNQPPTITCPADVMVNADAGSCFATGVSLGNPTTSDNCGTVTVTSNAPAQFPVGTNLVTWTATDASGNASTCQQRVIVRDNQPPAITCPADVTVNANTGSCFATGVSLGNPTANDNCGTVTVTSNAPAQFPVGTNLVTWTATDSSGNVTTCQQRVIVRDNQAPAITCPADVTVNADPGSCFATGVNLGTPMISDNCGAVTVTSNAPAQFPVGTNLVTWTVTDASGNVTTCQQRIIVRDNQAPTITCPADVTVNANSGSCFATGVSLGNPTANDNCGTVTVTSNAPAQFPVGTNLVTWTATDSTGNATPCQQRVVVRDNQPPMITCPSDMNGGAASGQSNRVMNFTAPAASDNCDASPNVTCAPASGSSFGVGATTVTCVATDVAGNSSSCSFTVTIAAAPQPQFGILAGMTAFNPQTGLFEQSVTVTNSGDATAAAVRLLVGGLRSGVLLFNATGNDGARPYVQHNGPLDPSQSVSFLLEFYVPDRRSFTNSLEAMAVLPTPAGTNAGVNVLIDRSFLDSRVSGEPRYVIEFTTTPGLSYTIIYSDDGGATWNAATPSITANSNRIQWYDDGPPKTISKPFSIQSRLYRVILAPANP